MYYSEISKIIEAGLERDQDKVASFAKLLAQKLEADGETRGSTRIATILERKSKGRAVTDSIVPPPMDQESRSLISSLLLVVHHVSLFPRLDTGWVITLEKELMIQGLL